MDLNIASQADMELRNSVIPCLIKSTGWKHVDYGVIRGNVGGHDYFLVAFPTLISYTDKHSKDVTEIWHKCGIRLMDKELAPKIMDWFVDNVFPSLTLRPFKDEDAKRGHFSYRGFRNYAEVAFFLNPSFPEGKWSNHAIEAA